MAKKYSQGSKSSGLFPVFYACPCIRFFSGLSRRYLNVTKMFADKWQNVGHL
jgi:hypothetical protein